MEKKEITTIQVSKELKHFLSSQAISKGETYDQIIRRLLQKIWGADIPQKPKVEGKDEVD